MIKTLIFDFGDVFINLDKPGALQHALELFELPTFEDDMLAINMQYEMGKISTREFIDFYLSKFPNLTMNQVVDAWNFILRDFPEYRLDFIEDLAREGNFKLMLLSNTNAMHIDFIKAADMGLYEAFRRCFDQFYLSHEIHLRKPHTEIFEFVLNQNRLNPSECLFIDDTEENTQAAKSMGIHVWNIDETKEDVVNLFEIKKDLF